MYFTQQVELELNHSVFNLFPFLLPASITKSINYEIKSNTLNYQSDNPT